MDQRTVLILVALFSALIAVVHYMVPQEQTPQIVFAELYYIPLLAGCMLLDRKGRIITYAMVSVLYIPHFSPPWTVTSLDLMSRILHLASTGVFTLLVDFLMERDRKRREQEEKDRQLVRVGQAATVIAHDLKSPLITILGFAKRAEAGKTDHHEALRIIDQCAHTMDKTIRDIMDFARPKQLDLNLTDLREVIRTAVGQCTMSAEEKGVTIETVLPEAALDLKVDAPQLARALINLINNAVEASPNGKLVKVVTREAGRTTRIDIIDEGVGMDDATRERIFEPFFTAKTGGTGLGAASAMQVVRAHGGSIEVRSVPGSGTTVTVELPAYDSKL
jgi:two-component system, NtrC family, sensor histidine kinase HydH